jgi:hypothetical protein
MNKFTNLINSGKTMMILRKRGGTLKKKANPLNSHGK